MRPDQSLELKSIRSNCPLAKAARAAGRRFVLAGVPALLFVGQSFFASVTLSAQSSSAPASAAAPAKKTHSAHATLAAAQPPPPVAATPAAPPAPDWPANDHPNEATVTWDSHGLSIVAANSSLVQILKDISLRTGATLEGLGKDQRIFGVYGPGPARDVINQLLDGSGYNVLMIGDLGQGTPRQIILSSQSNGAQPQGNSNAGASKEEDAEPDLQAQQDEAPEPPPPGRSGVAPPVPVRNQQQFIEQLRQRDQQIQQQNQQNQNPQ